MQLDLFCHIGMERTGSTAIQRFLSGNLEFLFTQGYKVPDFFRTDNHTKLVLLGYSELDPLTKIHLWNEVNRNSINVANKLLLRKLQDSNFSDSTTLMSSEFLSSKLRTNANIASFVKAIKSVYPQGKFLLVLRRHEELLISRYTNAVIDGSQLKFDPTPRSIPWAVNALGVAEAWKRIAGHDLIVNPYFEDFSHDELLSDYCDTIGLKYDRNLLQIPNRNTNSSLTSSGIEIVKQLNGKVGLLSKRPKRLILKLIQERTKHEPTFRPQLDELDATKKFFQEKNVTLSKFIAEEDRERFLYSSNHNVSNTSPDWKLIEQVVQESIDLLSGLKLKN